MQKFYKAIDGYGNIVFFIWQKPYQPKNIDDLYNEGHLKAAFFPEEREWHPFKLPIENQRQYQKFIPAEA